jgi:hypothetical protein
LVDASYSSQNYQSCILFGEKLLNEIQNYGNQHFDTDKKSVLLALSMAYGKISEFDKADYYKNLIDHGNNKISENKINFIFHDEDEIINEKHVEHNLLRTFYSDKACNFIHNSTEYKLDYNKIKLFEYKHEFMVSEGKCIKYVITFTQIPNDEGRVFFYQYFFDSSFNKVDSWSTFEEELKHLNFWATYKVEIYKNLCK